MTIEKITFEEIKPFLPDRVTLHYVDYRDDLSEQTELLQKCIHKQSKDSLYEASYDWFWGDFEGLNYELEQLKQRLEDHFNRDEDTVNVDDVMEEFEDLIRDHIYNVDDSDALKDLFRNTNDMIMFYDTGYYMESESWSWNDKRVDQEIRAILKHLGIKRVKKDSSTWNSIKDCVQNASYGGNLEIYFKDDVEDFLEVDPKLNKICFCDFDLGIVDHDNGSGYVTDCIIETVKLPFNSENLFIDKTVKYNWSYQIAGQDNYGTHVSFEKGRAKKIERSSINDHLDKEAEYNAAYKAGGCTYGDKDINRHRNVTYYNEPLMCRNECKDCKTYWID